MTDVAGTVLGDLIGVAIATCVMGLPLQVTIGLGLLTLYVVGLTAAFSSTE